MIIEVADKISLESNREKTPEGYLIIRDNKLARPGIIIYSADELKGIEGMPAGHKGKIRVFRHPATLLSDATIKTFDAKPFVVLHQGLLDAKNTTQVSSGMMFNVVAKEDGIYGDIAVHDAAAVKIIESGKMRELSLGYQSAAKWQPGVTEDGEPYDAVFTQYQGNHVALVPAGRNGPECAISDAATANEGTNMIIKIKDTEYVADAEGIALAQIAIDKLVEDIGSMTEQREIEANRKGKKKKLSAVATDGDDKDDKDEDDDEDDKPKAKMDAASAIELQERFDAVSKELAEKQVFISTFDSKVEERTLLIEDARRILGKSYSFQGKSNLAIMQDAVVKATGKSVEGKDESYVTARFDAAVEGIEKGTPKLFEDHAKNAAAAPKDNRSASVIAREKFIDKQHNHEGK